MKALRVPLLLSALLFLSSSSHPQPQVTPEKQWKRRHTITAPRTVIQTAISPTAPFLVGAHFGSFSIWNLDSGSLESTIKDSEIGDKQFINGLSYTPDGKHILAGVQVSLEQGSLNQYDTETGHCLKRIPLSATPVSFAFNGLGNRVAVGLTNKTVVIYSYPDFVEVKTLPASRFSVSSLMWSSDGTLLYTAGGWHSEIDIERTIHAPFVGEFVTWNVELGTRKEESVTAIGGGNTAFSPSSKMVASVSGSAEHYRNIDGVTKKWVGRTVSAYKLPDTEAGKPSLVAQITGTVSNSPNFPVMAWSHDGKILAYPASGDRTAKIYLWDGNVAHILLNELEGQWTSDSFLVNNLWFTKSGGHFVAAGSKFIRVWHKVE